MTNGTIPGSSNNSSYREYDVMEVILFVKNLKGDWDSFNFGDSYEDAHREYESSKDCGIDAMILCSDPQYGGIVHHLLQDHSKTVGCCQ